MRTRLDWLSVFCLSISFVYLVCLSVCLSSVYLLRWSAFLASCRHVCLVSFCPVCMSSLSVPFLSSASFARRHCLHRAHRGPFNFASLSVMIVGPSGSVLFSGCPRSSVLRQSYVGSELGLYCLIAGLFTGLFTVYTPAFFVWLLIFICPFPFVSSP